eukprot:403338399
MQNLVLIESKGFQNKIHVSVRMKPLTQAESIYEKNHFWQVINDQTIAQQQTKEQYSFDRVFNDDISTAQIFDCESKQLVLSSLEGFNVTIFAYGQTASGKTFTMRGTNESQGIIPLALTEVFQNLNQRFGKPFSYRDHHQVCTNLNQRSWNVKVSYLEIYNESVNDLLNPNKKNLDIRESRDKGIYIDGLSEFEVTSLEDTMSYLLKGDEQRAIAETKLNQKSSRSHTVFQINIMVRDVNLETGKTLNRTSQINLVDLAGSEGVNKTKSEGVRFREGTNINKSLLALSTVICKLGLKYQQAAKNFYINFRDSKLTRILQQPLSGNSQTAIICTMSQLNNNYQESRETLNFGAKAKNIKTFVNANEFLKESPEILALRIQGLIKENEDLRKKLRIQDLFDKSLEENKEDFSKLGFVKSHFDFLNKLIDEKGELLLQSEKMNQELQDKCDELQEKTEVTESQYQDIQKRFDELIVFNDESLHFSESLIKQKNELEQKLLNFESQLKSQEIIQNRFSLDNTMSNAFQVNQQSKLDISQTALLSGQKQKLSQVEQNEALQNDVLYLMQENEKLKSTIQIISDTKDDLQLQYEQQQQLIQTFKDQVASQKNELIRYMNNQRQLKIDISKKNKQITKKNFLIQALMERVDSYKKSNVTLFKELDQSITGLSAIQNDSQMNLNYVSIAQDDSQLVIDGASSNGVSQFQIQTLKAHIQELQTKVDVLTNEKRNLKVQVDVLTVDLDEAEKNIITLTVSLKDLDRDFEEINCKNEEIENDNQGRDMEIQDLEDHIDYLQKETTKLQKIQNQLNGEKEQLKTELVEKDHKIIQLEEEIKKLLSKKRSREEFEQKPTDNTARDDNLGKRRKENQDGNDQDVQDHLEIKKPFMQSSDQAIQENQNIFQKITGHFSKKFQEKFS